jgi:hypothetical protein
MPRARKPMAVAAPAEAQVPAIAETHQAPPPATDISAITGASGRLDTALMRAAIACVPVSSKATPEQRDQRIGAAFDLMRAHRPSCGAEGAMAALATSLFFGANDVLQRAARGQDLPAPVASQLYKTAAKLVEAYIGVTEALTRHQGGGPRQTVRVEHVTVEAGANAIIGSVSPAVNRRGVPTPIGVASS